jgi:hypothetical protein
MCTRTLATEAGDVTIREWGHETAERDRLLVALHAMGPVSTGAWSSGARSRSGSPRVP